MNVVGHKKKSNQLNWHEVGHDKKSNNTVLWTVGQQKKSIPTMMSSVGHPKKSNWKLSYQWNYVGSTIFNLIQTYSSLKSLTVWLIFTLEIHCTRYFGFPQVFFERGFCFELVDEVDEVTCLHLFVFDALFSQLISDFQNPQILET